MLIKKVSITFISLLFVNIMFAGDVSGRVSDAKSGDFLPGANVVLDGTNYGVSSD